MTRGNRIILFDLGGVLADLGEPAKTIGLDLAEERFWQIWLASANVHAFERGELETHEFFPKIADEFGQIDVDDFENRFHAWQLPIYAGVEEMIRSVRKENRVALLSNTNEVHWGQVINATNIFSTFDHLFLSFETGYYKPMAESFEQVVAHFECDPSDVLFLDDSPRNVSAAKELGFDAHQVCGVDEAKAVIARVGRQ